MKRSYFAAAAAVAVLTAAAWFTVPGFQHLSSAQAAPAPSLTGKSTGAPLDPAALKKIAEVWFAGMPIESVKETPYTGLYEIKTPRGFFYMNATADYIFAGDLLDVATKENVTQGRILDTQKFVFADLPLDNAFKLVRGNGGRKLVVFADPNCSYCKKLEAEWTNLNDVTIYVMPWAMLSQDSENKVKAFWCAKDPSSAWFTYMQTGQMPEKRACSDADRRVKAIQDLARTLVVQSTPTLFFQNNTRLNGVPNLETLTDRLAQK